jgi:FkbM family methyltransferase
MTNALKDECAASSRRVIISVSSDIGHALAIRWVDEGHEVIGTYRSESSAVDDLRAMGVTLFECDLTDATDVAAVAPALVAASSGWDALVLAPGTLAPAVSFQDADFDQWERSFDVNLFGPLRILHTLLPGRRRSSHPGPMVLFFSGSGSNGPAPGLSAYALAKVAATKMVELLDAEVADTRFAILGPGWVDTKIHEPVLALGKSGGDNFERTRARLLAGDTVPLDTVVDCCEWMLSAPRDVIGGRNISLVHDAWDDPGLTEALRSDQEMYKLRRSGNERTIRPDGSPLPSSNEDLLSEVLQALPGLAGELTPGSATYRVFEGMARSAVARMFGPGAPDGRMFGPFGKVSFPYVRMGAIDSLDLFGLDELILFAFYAANRGTYRNVADIGANIGLHTLVQARCGFNVRSFEPDPRHIDLLKGTVASNGLDTVEVVEAAVSDSEGSAQFVRVLGNTTGSHLAGAKSDPYGDLDRFDVRLVAFGDILSWADLMKIDVEGHEATIVCATTSEQWDGTDAVLEIGSIDNAAEIFDHCCRIGLNLFTQRNGWRRAETIDDVPASYRHGSAFLSKRSGMPGMGA